MNHSVGIAGHFLIMLMGCQSSLHPSIRKMSKKEKKIFFLVKPLLMELCTPYMELCNSHTRMFRLNQQVCEKNMVSPIDLKTLIIPQQGAEVHLSGMKQKQARPDLKQG